MLKRTDRCSKAGEKEYSVIHKVVVCVLKFPLAGSPETDVKRNIT